MYVVTPNSESFFNEFDTFISAHSEPVPTASPYAQYKVMELAKGKVSVTLDGQGADEMLGGYVYFHGIYFKELLKNLKLRRLLKEVSNTKYSREVYQYALYYLLPMGLKNYAERKKGSSIASDFYSDQAVGSKISQDLYNPQTLNSSFLQHFEYKLEHLLKWEDLNSMHFSIESRVPFLDHNLVEKTLSLPSNLVLNNGTKKYILREAVKDILPEKIYNRKDKNGFAAPSDDWFRKKHFRDFIFDHINSGSFKNRGYFDVADCNKKYKLHLAGTANLSKDIWKWINLELWSQKFIDR
jgi:asparagine synthase (glutamine-hydrolysing)